MMDIFPLPKPAIAPPLDPEFQPAVLANHAFSTEVERSGDSAPLIMALEREDGSVSRYETQAFPEAHPMSTANHFYAERLLKFLLWQRGAHKAYVAGPAGAVEYLRACYTLGGTREFDYTFMGEQVYEKTFAIVACRADEVPPSKESTQPLGRHLDGCRIGFDLGASDRKVSAVIDGESVYSEEVVWEPGKQEDPEYHYREIKAALDAAASKMPRVDAIGGSSAGVLINNRPRVASLFRRVPPNQYHKVHDLFARLQREFNVPFEVVNDGEVTALAGSMSLGDNAVLGIALGSSEAGGYVNPEGHITGWLNELAFAPVDYSPAAPVEDWSGDRGVGALYFSQQCVFRLAPKVKIKLPDDVTDAERLKLVQEKLEHGEEAARKIWETMGVYLGYGIAHYADFYELRHVLILGRCTSGSGGDVIVAWAKRVLETEFPELSTRIQLHLPDETTRRVGQSIAAASLPPLHH